MLKYAAKGLLERNIPLQNTRCSWVALDWKRRKKCKLRSTVNTVFFFFCISGRCCVCCCCCRCFTPCKRIRFQNLGNFCLWNPEFQILESGMQLKESRIPLTIWIRNPSSADKDSGILYQQSGIHGVETVLDSFTWSELFWEAKPNEEYHVSVVFHKKAEVRICIYLHMLIC